MASSSVSQEDVEVDYEATSRRSRIRTARARNCNSSASRPGDDYEDGDGVSSFLSLSSGAAAHSWLGGAAFGLHSALQSTEHISPKPLNRIKEKRAIRPGNICKGKQQRDRRKLREKRRSTGVMHVPSTESTGGSTGEDDELLSLGGSSELRRAAGQNAESSVPPQHQGSIPLPDTRAKKTFSKPRNKSPSDLEADDEDNQDYDSLTMSDSTLSLAQPSRPGTVPPTAMVAPKHPPITAHHHHARSLAHANTKYELLKQHQLGNALVNTCSGGPPALVRGASYCSGVCSRGGHVMLMQTSGQYSPGTVGNRLSGGRPATPSSHSSEELLERAREENRRLLELLAEREQRIAALEGRLALVSAVNSRTVRSFDGPHLEEADGEGKGGLHLSTTALSFESSHLPSSGGYADGAGNAAVSAVSSASSSASSVATTTGSMSSCGGGGSSSNISSSANTNNDIDNATACVALAFSSLTTD